MTKWVVEENRAGGQMLNVVDENNSGVAFFYFEEDAKRCVEAVNSVERMREIVKLATEHIQWAATVTVFTHEDGEQIQEDAAETLREIAELEKDSWAS